MAFLKVFSNGEERTVFLGDDPVVVGRGADVDVMVVDRKASREHCVIEPVADGRWRVLDLRSANGIKVNGKKTAKAVLEADDVVSIGDVRIVFAGEAVAVVQPAVAAAPPVRDPEEERAASRNRRRKSAAPFIIMGTVLVAAFAVLLFVWDNSGGDRPEYGKAEALAFAAVKNSSSDQELVELSKTYLHEYPGSAHEAEVRKMSSSSADRLRQGTSATAHGYDFESEVKDLPTLDAIAKLSKMLEKAEPEHKQALEELLQRYRDRLDSERATLFDELEKVFAGHVEEGEFARAREIWFFLRGDPRFEPIPAAYINRIVHANSGLEANAAAARTRLFEEVGRAESAHDFARARDLLSAALPRFAGTSVVRSLRERLAFVKTALASGVSGKPTAAPTTVRLDVEKRVQAALATLSGRDFRGVATTLRGLADSMKKDRGYRELDARAKEVEAAAALHDAVVKSLVAGPAPKKRIAKRFYVLGGDANGVGVRSKGKQLRYTWAEVPAAIYLALASREAADNPLGYCVLSWAVGGDAALVVALAEAVKAKGAGAVHGFIAVQVRHEKQPEGGYVAHAGKVVSRKEYHRLAEEALIKRQTRQMTDAYAAIRADPALKKLDKLEAAKDALDKARNYAKELIYDEKKYFYPYRGSGRMKEYLQVQREVDARVAVVRGLWDNTRPSSIKESPELAKALARFDSAAAELEKRLIDVEEQVAQVAFLRSYFGKKFNIRNFYRSPGERELLDYCVEVMALNEKVEGDISGNERAQVRVTNDYRVMFGHQAVRIIEELAKSSRGHCVEMGKLGYFGHFSPTPGRRTPYDRMKLEGYRYGASENIIMGNTTPEGSHHGWCHSSGHHRNLLMAQWTEMGTGHSGRYMCQNFGMAPKWREKQRQAEKKDAERDGAGGGDAVPGCGCGEDDDDFDYDDEG